MLLRQSEPADADHYISAVAAMGSPEQQPPPDTPTRVDPLDDVFGSDGGDDHHGSALFDGENDDFEDHDAEDGGSAWARARDHPSDIRRLRQEHTTAGYREGITAAKASSVQAGFDEGFGLGGTIGLRAGYLLGVLEGIAAATATAAGGEAGAGAAKLLADARAELGVQSLFSEEYWHADGMWKYEVAGADGGDDEEVLFSHVAEAHPLMMKWASAAEAEMRRWGVDEQLPLLRRRDDDEPAAAEPVARARPTGQAQPDAKAASDALSW